MSWCTQTRENGMDVESTFKYRRVVSNLNFKNSVFPKSVARHIPLSRYDVVASSEHRAPCPPLLCICTDNGTVFSVQDCDWVVAV